MSMLVNVVLAVQMLSALGMIGLILIQHGKGADMGAAFGSGSSGSLFGASGSANFLSRSTAACATVFFLCTLALTYINSTGRAAATGRTVLDGPPPATAPAASGAALPAAPASAALGVPAPMSNPVPAPIPATPAPAASK